MDALIWGGAAVSLLGLLGLIWCIVQVMRARRENLEDADLRARLARVMPMNLAAMLLSVFGLMMVVIGIFLS